jgi:hypothetical protein
MGHFAYLAYIKKLYYYIIDYYIVLGWPQAVIAEDYGLYQYTQVLVIPRYETTLL